VTPPPAATAAARAKPRRSVVPSSNEPRPTRSSARSASGGRSNRRAPSARRSSGPASRASRPASAPRSSRSVKASLPRARTSSRTPEKGRWARRVSGPAKPTKRALSLPQLRPVPVLGTIGSHAFRAGRSLPDSRLVDRLMRGRAWIALLGVLLIGLVAINVSLLKLNSEAGRNTEKVKSLRIENTQLQAKVSRLASADRLERAGRDLGLGMSIAARVRYLSVRPGDARQAARAIRTWQDVPTFAFAPLPEPPAPPPTPAQTTPVQTTPAANAAPVVTQTPAANGAPAPGASVGTQPQGTTPAPGAGAQPPTAAPPPSTAGGGTLPAATG
jgi:hypothetical protein